MERNDEIVQLDTSPLVGALLNKYFESHFFVLIEKKVVIASVAKQPRLLLRSSNFNGRYCFILVFKKLLRNLGPGLLRHFVPRNDDNLLFFIYKTHRWIYSAKPLVGEVGLLLCSAEAKVRVRGILQNFEECPASEFP